LFRDQTESYRESVVPYGSAVLGWTAGEPSTLRNLVGPLGTVYGMTRFGASAPFTVLDQKFGYTADNVVKVAEEYLAQYKATVKKSAALAKTSPHPRPLRAPSPLHSRKRWMERGGGWGEG
jgi:hypothetical protein